jgi:hypothetical protein
MTSLRAGEMRADNVILSGSAFFSAAPAVLAKAARTAVQTTDECRVMNVPPALMTQQREYQRLARANREIRPEIARVASTILRERRGRRFSRPK